MFITNQFTYIFEGTIFALYWIWPEQTGLYHNFDIGGTEKGPKTLSKSTSFIFFFQLTRLLNCRFLPSLTLRSL